MRSQSDLIGKLLFAGIAAGLMTFVAIMAIAVLR